MKTKEKQVESEKDKVIIKSCDSLIFILNIFFSFHSFWSFAFRYYCYYYFGEVRRLNSNEVTDNFHCVTFAIVLPFC